VSFLPITHQILLLALVLAGGFFDWRERRIPNWLTLMGVVLGFGLNGTAYGGSGLLISLKGFGLALAVYFTLYAIRAMGAGDVKLMAAVGSVAGWSNWLGVFILTAIIGGVGALVAILLRRRVGRTFRNLGLILVALRLRQAPYELSQELDVTSEQALRLPHGVFIMLGVLAFLAITDIWAPR
jgi:prepilin peptidase CpaA